jgi:hypothetical protein
MRLSDRLPTRAVALTVTIGAALVAGSHLAAQTTLAQLGLTETAARNFVLAEIKSPALERRNPIVIAGTRAFLKLPANARAAAATGLFAWAKAYVNSAAFKASYDGYRKGRIPTDRQYSQTIDEAVKQENDEMLAGIEQLKQALPSLPPAQRQQLLAKIKEAQATLANPEMIKARRDALAAERGQAGATDAKLVEEVEQQTPADPQRLFARRLREFLEVTAAVNFSAPTINLTGGMDGIEFIDKADRQQHWMWKAAAIVGPEATTAARAAAQAWLKEIER